MAARKVWEKSLKKCAWIILDLDDLTWSPNVSKSWKIKSWTSSLGNHQSYLVSYQNIIYMLRTAFKWCTHSSSCSAVYHCTTSFILYKSQGFLAFVNNSTPPKASEKISTSSWSPNCPTSATPSTLSVTLHLRVNYFVLIFLPQAILVVLEGHQTPVPKRPILLIKAHLRPPNMLAGPPFSKHTSPHHRHDGHSAVIGRHQFSAK